MKKMGKKWCGVKLSKVDQMTWDLDKHTLADLGLKMPRFTPKYWLGVCVLSEIQLTSPYFFHVTAAQYGRDTIFKDLEQSGYFWNGDKWVKG